MIGVKIGELVTFVPTGIEVKVASDDTIEYEERIYKLSPFVGTFLPIEKQTPSELIRGPSIFRIKVNYLMICGKRKKKGEKINSYGLDKNIRI